MAPFDVTPFDDLESMERGYVIPRVEEVLNSFQENLKKCSDSRSVMCGISKRWYGEDVAPGFVSVTEQSFVSALSHIFMHLLN